MIRKTLMISTLLVLACGSALAQQSRAEGALGGIPGADTRLNQGKINEVVIPYQTDTPPESNYEHSTFEQRIYDTRQQHNDQGRVLRATEDSAAVRPGVDIDGQGPLFDDANWAHENADAIAGNYFTSETGQCTEPSVPVSNIMDRFCESTPAREIETCDLIRDIWVDRTDFYRCDKRAANFVRVCQRVVTNSCQVWNGNTACIQRNVRFFGAEEMWWEGRTAVLTVRGPVGPLSAGIFGTKDAHISMQISDHFKADQVILQAVHSLGTVALWIDNGTPIDFFGWLWGDWHYADTYSFLYPNRHGSVTPATGKRWAVSNLRIYSHFNIFVTRTGVGPQTHTFARVWIEFAGSCCDAFPEQGTEQCE